RSPTIHMDDSTSAAGFSADEQHTLSAVLDEIIPPSDDGKLPGAGQLGIGRYIDEALQNLPAVRSMVAQGLAELDDLARRKDAPDFAALSRDGKVQLLNQQGFVFALTFYAYAGYYQDARVLEALGREARPPHPAGYQMEPNDLSLLD